MSKDVNIRYVETDLSELVEEKKHIIEQIDPSFLQRTNYSIIPLNVVSSDDFLKTDGVLMSGKVAVINEGLLPYLSLEEKEIVAKNIWTLLKKHGGVWITPDLSNSGRMQKILEVFPNAHIMNKKLNKLVGRDLKNNSIPGGKEDALRFYRDIGFSIVEYRATDLSGELKTLNKVADESKKKALFDALDVSSVWVLEAN